MKCECEIKMFGLTQNGYSESDLQNVLICKVTHNCTILMIFLRYKTK